MEASAKPSPKIYAITDAPAMIHPLTLSAISELPLNAIIISIATSIFSGIVLFFIKRYFDNKEKIEIEKEKARQKENVLILKSIDAIGRLTYADSIAIRDGKINGEMKDAVQSYIAIKSELYDYLIDQNSKRK